MESFPSSGGIEPVSWLPLRSRNVRLESFPSSGGIEPVSALELRSRRVRLDSFPNSAGIGPVNVSPRVSSVGPSWSQLRLDRSASSAGIGPAPYTINSPTRPSATVTPTPHQRAIGVSVSQLMGARPKVPELSAGSNASSTSQSSTSPPLVTDEPPTAAEPEHP